MSTGMIRREATLISRRRPVKQRKTFNVLVVPRSTSVQKADHPVHLLLNAGETGLAEDSIARAEDITVVPESELREPRTALRLVSCRRISDLADKVNSAMGC